MTEINLTPNGFLPSDCPVVFFRVEDGWTRARISDWTTAADAEVAANAWCPSDWRRPVIVMLTLVH